MKLLGKDKPQPKTTHEQELEVHGISGEIPDLFVVCEHCEEVYERGQVHICLDRRLLRARTY